MQLELYVSYQLHAKFVVNMLSKTMLINLKIYSLHAVDYLGCRFQIIYCFSMRKKSPIKLSYINITQNNFNHRLNVNRCCMHMAE